MGTDKTTAMATKLHRQFGHPTAKKLVNLIRTAGIRRGDLEKAVNKVSDNCDICMKYKKTSRPVVSVPMATVFNEMVAMDLKAFRGGYFLVMVDVATRFCAAKLIRNKLPATIINGLFTSWICVFGAPKKILSDNGGEFNNTELRDLGEAFNIRVMATAAESPWSNGVCERMNAVIGGTVDKIRADIDCDPEVALAWAVSARNALSTFSGYSPNQLVFGRNPAFPNVFQDDPPALSGTPASSIVRDNLNAMHAAREEFIKVEASERIKKALSHNIRPTLLPELHSGDSVYYKRNDSNK